MAIIFLIEWAAGWISVTGLFRTAAPGISFAEAILRPLLLFIFVGIVEEVIFRGYLLQNLAEAFNLPSVGPRAAMPAAWLLSSILFGLAHAGNPFASPTSTLYLMIAGLFLGLGYILTGELAIPIGLHITWNFFQGNVFGFPVSGNPTSGTTVIAIEQGGPVIWTGGRFGPEAGLLGVLANLVGMVLILLWLRARRGHVSLYLPLALPPVDVERPAG
ncbi:MAG: hypothetical protein KatS3mg057_0409 [Herpetosiphonaceae bacterium]|nr:MAG: hypothetical protein KatS3mg057_0409 [Herpetosiphonaceae bacterium]